VLGIPAVDSNLDAAAHGQSISFEFIAQKNADYLFVIDRASATGSGDKAEAKALVENELIKKSKAFQNNHSVYLNQSIGTYPVKDWNRSLRWSVRLPKNINKKSTHEGAFFYFVNIFSAKSRDILLPNAE